MKAEIAQLIQRSLVERMVQSYLAPQSKRLCFYAFLDSPNNTLGSRMGTLSLDQQTVFADTLYSRIFKIF